MASDTQRIDSRTVIEMLSLDFSEDPHREPYEKETSFHLEGDGTHFTVTSFKRVIFTKLLYRPEFEITHLHVLDEEGRERTVTSLADAANMALPIIGVMGTLPVGAVNIGTARQSNSHADLVK